MSEKPLNKREFDPIKEIVISENGKAVKWQVTSTEEGGEFIMHGATPYFHEKTLTVRIRRECDGHD